MTQTIDQWAAEYDVTYNPETGWFIRACSPDSRAGSLYSNGYRYIWINGVRYREHRLAFLFMTGSMPEQIDHINRVKDDNRWCNIRPVTSRENHENAIYNGDFVGVWYRKERNRWVANNSAENNVRRKKLGSFKTHLAACYCRWAHDIGVLA